MNRSKNRDYALILLSSVFFIWGFITVASNSLIPHYKQAFNLDYQTVMLFLFSFFITRIVTSLPISFLMEKIGYKRTLKYCLYWCFLGCLVMSYCVQTETLSLTLLGILLMASGISSIQVVSSPYVSLLASPEQSMRRQSIATASNSIGTVLGPIILSSIIVVTNSLGLVDTGKQISILFLAISLFFLGLVFCFKTIDLPDIKPRIRVRFFNGLFVILKSPKFMKIAAVLLLYVGVEVCFGTFTITYLADDRFGGLGLVRSTQLIALYWALMFLGRFIFAKYGHRIHSFRLFTIMCALSIVVCLIATQVVSVMVGYLMIMIGLFNSTLYPIIYAKALKVSGNYSSQGAAILIMCSIGGAILPMIQAVCIDEYGLSASYWIPVISYVIMVILFRGD